MISTGVSGLDEMLGSGIPRGSRVLYSLEPGVDGQLFMLSSLSCALAKGLSCLVILPHTTVDAFRNDAEKMYGARLNLASGPVVFMDAIDRERIQKTSRSDESRGREWQARIRKICKDHSVDVIFAYFDLLYEDFGIEKAIRFLESARDDAKITLILEHLNLEGTPLLERFTHEFAFDLVIGIRSAFRPVPQFNYFTLAHTSYSPAAPKSIPFIITEGRIIPYIPKIVVTGPPHAGKSTFVSQASNEGQSVERRSPEGEPTTVAMDFGWLRWKDFDITLYGTPGHSRFDSLLPTYLKHAMGVILVVDATKPETFPRAKHLIEMTVKRRIPYVIAANKHDLPHAVQPGEIRAALGVSDEIPIYPISATKRSDVHFVLESLVDSITQFSY
jgi:hypothetical protein